MNILNLTFKGLNARIFALLTIVSLLLSAFPAAFFVAEAGGKIDICHYNNGNDGSYNKIEVSKYGLSGHGNDSNDIIPAYDQYPGKNWDAEGQAIYNNDCKKPDAAVSIDVIGELQCGIQEVSLSGMVTFLIPTDTDELVIKLDGNVVHGDEDIDDAGPDGVPQPWNHTLVGLSTGSHSVEVVMYDVPGDYNSTVKASANTSFTIEECPPTESSETIVVYENDLALTDVDWYFWVDSDSTAITPNNTALTSSQNGQFEFSNDPDTQKIGEGNILLNFLDNPDQYGIATNKYAGLKLADIVSAKYSTYKIATDAVANIALAFNFDEDVTDLDNSWQGRLVFEPYHSYDTSEAKALDEWKTWDAIDGGGANWWTSNGSVLGGSCVQSSPCTIDEIISLAPNAGVQADALGQLFLKGGSSNSGLTSHVDEFVVGVYNKGENNIHTTTYDFEPNPPQPVCEMGENLLDNGSFEDPEVKHKNLWDKFSSVASWLITKVTGGDTTTLEIHEGWSGNEAADGDQYAELDGDHSTKVSQTVSTVEGAKYELKWAFAPRHSRPAEDNQLSVLINGSEVASSGPATGSAGLEAEDWTLSSYVFKADSDSTEISFADAGPSNSYGTYLDNAVLCKIADPVDEVTVVANKVVCEDEADLPNYQDNGGANITANTAADWVAQNPGCKLEPNWQFQWYPDNISNDGVGDDTFVGEKGGLWTTFSAGTTTIDITDIDGLSFREVLKDGYIPFTYITEGEKNTNNVTAEFHCSTGGKNYDNLEWAKDVKDGDVINCVAFNVPEEAPTCSITIKSDTTNVVEETGLNAVLTYVHNNWVKTLPVAKWIWGSEYVETPIVAGEEQTFVNKFGWNPAVPITNATLKIAADNQYSADLNGLFTNVDTNANNFSSLDEFDVTGDIVGGNNIFSATVTNLAGSQDPKGNPAGLYYELVITGEGNNCEYDYVPEPEYAPYCGDGEVDGWEMCELGDKGCTDYCTYENMCTDLKLAKVDFIRAPESISFDDEAIVIGEDKLIPAGVWFNFDDVENGDLHDLATDNENLVLNNNGSELGFSVLGGNPNNKFDYVFADIHFKGIELGSTNESNAVVGWPLEDSSSNYPDIFDKDGNEKITMEWYLTTGGDAATIAYTQGEEYDCPECKAVAEARIMIDDYGYAGAGQDNADILLGDGTRVAFGEWFPVTALDNSGDFITDTDNATNFPNAETTDGLFVSRNGNGTINVVLVGEHSPGGNTNHEYVVGTLEVRDIEIADAEEIPGDFKFENHPENNGVPTNDGFDELSNITNTSVDFKMWVDTASDGFKVTLDEETLDYCEDDDEDVEPDTYTIDGYKYSSDSESYGLSGWEITLKDKSGVVATTTTDISGYYSFEVPTGYYEVHEEDRTNWTQEHVYVTGAGGTTSDQDFNYCIFDEIEYGYGDNYRCSFENSYDEPEQPVDVCLNIAGNQPSLPNGYEFEGENCVEEDGGSSQGTLVGFSNASPQRLVAGASTDFCPLINDYMQIGTDNNPFEVTKLQLFLNMFRSVYGGVENPITGVFDQTTDANVKTFQEYYRSEILDPWYNLGIVPHNKPTGFVYKLTKWKINSIVCPIETSVPSLDGEDLSSNVDLD